MINLVWLVRLNISPLDTGSFITVEDRQTA